MWLQKKLWVWLLAISAVYCLEYTCPNMCSCFVSNSTTDCQGAGLEDLPDGIYLEVVNLDLSQNKFTAIPSLNIYEELKWLNISYNKLTRLNRTSLAALDKLEVLDLSNNLFTQWLDFNRYAFAGAKMLNELILSHNTLKNFPEIYVPLNSPSLTVLKLVNCSITDLHGDIFVNLPKIREVDMSLNTFNNLRGQIKSNSLQNLNLMNCDIRYIDWEFLDSLTNLNVLILSQNFELRKFSSKSDSLKVIDLSHCNLNTVPGSRLPNLIQMKLSGNHIRQLYSNTFKNYTKLEFLDISNNAVWKIDSLAFAPLEAIYTINLSYNTISFIDPKAFASNFNLEKLLVSHNYLTTVPMFDIESLKYLNLRSCEIRTVGRDSLTQMPNLEEINLSNNLISKLPDDLLSDSLRTLDLSLCHISKINNRTFSSMPLLKSLNLAGNRLTSDVKLEYLPQISYIRLDDNPWRCDCTEDLRRLYEWLLYISASSLRLRCQSPENVEGMLWSSACEDDWSPKGAQKDIMWWYSLGLIVSLIVMFCVAFSIRRAYQQKEQRVRQQEEQDRNEARERLRIMRLQQREAREAENRNAPDPRELQTPPTYTEALLMSSSLNSLTGSRQSLSSSRSNHNKKGRPRRKRRKDKGESSSEERTTRSVRHTENTESDENNDGRHTITLESDF